MIPMRKKCISEKISNFIVLKQNWGDIMMKTTLKTNMELGTKLEPL
jgi:hypothetical protein